MRAYYSGFPQKRAKFWSKGGMMEGKREGERWRIRG